VRILHEGLLEVLGDERRVLNIVYQLRMHHAVAGRDLDEQGGRFADAAQDAAVGRGNPELVEGVSHEVIEVSAQRRVGGIEGSLYAHGCSGSGELALAPVRRPGANVQFKGSAGRVLLARVV